MNGSWGGLPSSFTNLGEYTVRENPVSWTDSECNDAINSVVSCPMENLDFIEFVMRTSCIKIAATTYQSMGATCIRQSLTSGQQHSLLGDRRYLSGAMQCPWLIREVMESNEIPAFFCIYDVSSQKAPYFNLFAFVDFLRQES